MERRSANLNFTIRIAAKWLHWLLNSIARRAYMMGYEDARDNHSADAERAEVDPSQLRKLL